MKYEPGIYKESDQYEQDNMIRQTQDHIYQIRNKYQIGNKLTDIVETNDDHSNKEKSEVTDKFTDDRDIINNNFYDNFKIDEITSRLNNYDNKFKSSYNSQPNKGDENKKYNNNFNVIDINTLDKFKINSDKFQSENISNLDKAKYNFLKLKEELDNLDKNINVKKEEDG